MEKCAELEKKMLKELEMIESKLGTAEMTETDLKRVDMLTHALKSLATYKAMKGYDCDEDDQNWSGRRGRNPANGQYVSRMPMYETPIAYYSGPSGEYMRPRY